jgi:hypothetical protein
MDRSRVMEVVSPKEDLFLQAERQRSLKYGAEIEANARDVEDSE